MTTPQLPELWTSFSPQTQRHLIALWTHLLHRSIQAQRLPPTGGPHDPRYADTSAAIWLAQPSSMSASRPPNNWRCTRRAPAVNTNSPRRHNDWAGHNLGSRSLTTIWA